jgi:hypothetical protein
MEEDGEIEREVQIAVTVQNARSSAKMGTTKMRVDVEWKRRRMDEVWWMGNRLEFEMARWMDD